MSPIRSRNRWRWRAALATTLATGIASDTGAKSSVCYGSPADGRLDDGISLPLWGANFRAYSAAGWTLGRTFVHDQVAATLLDAWRALETATPGATYVYGETGWPRGGRIRPHRTHRNGLSVDLMVPVLRNGKSVPRPPARPIATATTSSSTTTAATATSTSISRRWASTCTSCTVRRGRAGSGSGA